MSTARHHRPVPLGARRRRWRRSALVLAASGALAASSLGAVSVAGSAPDGARGMARAADATVIASGLDNPRQVVLGPARRNFIVAEAGHGGDECGADGTCIGPTGKVRTISPGGATRTVMSGLLSGAGEDGSFAVGADGAGKRSGGHYFAIITEAPPDIAPEGLVGEQSGKLLSSRGGSGKLREIADIARFEERRDVDGEGVESNPYSVLVLKKKVLVADAAGDYIASVGRRGAVRLWATMPEYGRRVDAVPTVISKGRDGRIYVGELHSEIPGAAKVHRFNRRGELLRSWEGFTGVTGIAVAGNGTLYVSELFGGTCGFDQIPECFPGRVVRVQPDGRRGARDVPFPAGVALRNGTPYVAAFSISPATGFGGNPDWSGQLWRLNGF